MLLPRVNWTTRLVGAMRELGPYAAIGLILPGGSLIAFSLWAFRRRSWFAAHVRRALAIVRMSSARSFRVPRAARRPDVSGFARRRVGQWRRLSNTGHLPAYRVRQMTGLSDASRPSRDEPTRHHQVVAAHDLFGVYRCETLHGSDACCSPHVRQIRWSRPTLISGIAEAQVPEVPTERQPQDSDHA